MNIIKISNYLHPYKHTSIRFLPFTIILKIRVYKYNIYNIYYYTFKIFISRFKENCFSFFINCSYPLNKIFKSILFVVKQSFVNDGLKRVSLLNLSVEYRLNSISKSFDHLLLGIMLNIANMKLEHESSSFQSMFCDQWHILISYQNLEVWRMNLFVLHDLQCPCSGN